MSRRASPPARRRPIPRRSRVPLPLARLSPPLALALAATLAPAAFRTAAAAQEFPEPFAIRDVRVFDGALTAEARTVVIERGVITAVGPEARIPDGIRVIDGTGLTLLPGLIDAHAHAVYVDDLRRALAFGVTTVLDMFASHEQAASIREGQAAGRGLDLADLRSAGTVVTAPGGHGTQYGLPIPTIEEPEEADAFVEARIAEGSDYIKIIYGHPARMPTIDRATLEAVVRVAHARDRLAVVHVETLAGARDAVEAGADGLVHGWMDAPPDAALLERMAEAGTFVVPTLGVLRSISGTAGGAGLAEDPRLAPYLRPEDAANLERAVPAGPAAPRTDLFDVALEVVRLLDEAGVPVLAGSDAPNSGTAHGASVHREMELLVQAGLTPLEALTAATSAAARAFGLDDRGRVAPGKRADLVLVRGDPSVDVTAARDIVRVWKLGVAVDREARAREAADATRDGGSP